MPTGISRWLKCPVSTCTHGKRRESGALGRTAAAVRKVKRSESHSVVSDSLRPHGLYSSWNSPGLNTRVGSLFLLQGIFPHQGIESRSPTLQADSLPAELQGKPKNIGVGSLSRLQGIFLTQESNWVSCITGFFYQIGGHYAK